MPDEEWTRWRLNPRLCLGNYTERPPWPPVHLLPGLLSTHAEVQRRLRQSRSELAETKVCLERARSQLAKETSLSTVLSERTLTQLREGLFQEAVDLGHDLDWFERALAYLGCGANTNGTRGNGVVTEGVNRSSLERQEATGSPETVAEAVPR